MSLSPELQEAVARAKAAVRADPKHALKPYYRQQIYDALFLGPKGKEVRARLDIGTAERVLSLWEDEWPEGSLPSRLIQRATDVLQGVARPEMVRAEAHDAWVELEKLGEESTRKLRERAFYAAQAAVEATFCATGIDRWETIEIGTSEDDADLDPWSSDTASWAAAAYAGVPWEEASSAVRRLEFWRWWLSEAILKAWQETYTSSSSST